MQQPTCRQLALWRELPLVHFLSGPYSSCTELLEYRNPCLFVGMIVVGSLGSFLWGNTPNSVALSLGQKCEAGLDKYRRRGSSAMSRARKLDVITQDSEEERVTLVLVCPLRHLPSSLEAVVDAVSLPQVIGEASLPQVMDAASLPWMMDAASLPQVMDAARLPWMMDAASPPQVIISFSAIVEVLLLGVAIRAQLIAWQFKQQVCRALMFLIMTALLRDVKWLISSSIAEQKWAPMSISRIEPDITELQPPVTSVWGMDLDIGLVISLGQEAESLADAASLRVFILEQWRAPMSISSIQLDITELQPSIQSTDLDIALVLSLG